MVTCAENLQLQSNVAKLEDDLKDYKELQKEASPEYQAIAQKRIDKIEKE